MRLQVDNDASSDPAEGLFFVEIDGFRTLPLFVMKAILLEPLGPFSSASFQPAYADPTYEIPAYRHTAEWLVRIGANSEEAKNMVNQWGLHSANYKYFCQIIDDPYQERILALQEHAQLISTLCDARLGIDTTDLWSQFNEIAHFHLIHLDYRKDKNKEKNYSQYIPKLKEVADKMGTIGLSVNHLMDRVKRQIELKASIWAKMPPIYVKASVDKGIGYLRKARLF